MQPPRLRRLSADHERLQALARASQFIDFEVVGEESGVPNEYKVTLTCRGVVGVDSKSGRPVFGDRHELLVQLPADYPRSHPVVVALSEILHPNIYRTGRRIVDFGPWHPMMGLDDVVLLVGEMIQYKTYWAGDKPPHPAEIEVAEWVRWAEKMGYVGPDKPFDDRPLTSEPSRRPPPYAIDT